jgi:hypothetical protein
MAVANALAYYEMATITEVKSFIVQAPRNNHTKSFLSICTRFLQARPI